MKPFWKCAWYLAIVGIFGFLLGRILPKSWFSASRFPYKSRSWERDGAIYERIGIRRWQNKVPDMSRILPKFLPAKNLSGNFRSRLPLMIQETCVAELIHILIAFFGLACPLIWKGMGGWCMAMFHIVFLNLPFILIQRYNRPRLLRLLKLERGRCREGGAREGADFKL